MKKTALITGASGGIGKEFAILHAENGGNLILVARSENKLNELKQDLEQKHGIKAEVIVKDLDLPNAAKELYETVKSSGIEVDYLINNAGFGGIGNFHERDIKEDLAMIRLNVEVLTELTYYFLQDFITKNSGKILNVSSTASLMPGPLQAVYFATKAYVASFSNAIAEELKGMDITVTNLMPGATETDFGKVSGMDKTVLFDKTASPRKVAQDGYNGMINGKLDVISGLSFGQKVMNMMLPFLPKKLVLKQVKQMQQPK